MEASEAGAAAGTGEGSGRRGERAERRLLRWPERRYGELPLRLLRRERLRGWRGSGEEGLDGDEAGQGGALLVGEAFAEAGIVGEGGLALVGREVADLAEGTGDEAAAIGRKAGELGHGSADLLAADRVEVLHGLGAGEDALALVGRHHVELGEAVAHALLDLRGELAEAGLALEGALLLRQGEVAVAAHPLGEVLVALGAEALGRRWGVAGALRLLRGRRELRDRREGAAGESRDGDQHEGRGEAGGAVGP